MKSKLTKNIVARLSLALVLALIVLVLMSWLLSATTGDNVRSLLSPEGIRFFFGGFAGMLQQPLLVWLLLLSMAWGCLRDSGLLSGVGGRHKGYHRRLAILLVVILLMVYVGLILLLTTTSHAVLLSATGRLWPSPFSRALVPVLAFGVVLLSAVYGLVSRSYQSLADVCQSLVAGIASAAPLLFLYVLVVQLCCSLRFVFG